MTKPTRGRHVQYSMRSICNACTQSSCVNVVLEAFLAIFSYLISKYCLQMSHQNMNLGKYGLVSVFYFVVLVCTFEVWNHRATKKMDRRLCLQSLICRRRAWGKVCIGPQSKRGMAADCLTKLSKKIYGVLRQI